MTGVWGLFLTRVIGTDAPHLGMIPVVAFLAGVSTRHGPRDLYCADVKLNKDGHASPVRNVRNLTQSNAGDEYDIITSPPYVAVPTRALQRPDAPLPRAKLLRCHGILAPHAKRREAVVPKKPDEEELRKTRGLSKNRILWAALLARTLVSEAGSLRLYVLISVADGIIDVRSSSPLL